MYSSRTTVGEVREGEQCIDFSPKYKGRNDTPGVGFVHGAGSNADYCLAQTPANQAALTQKVATHYPAIAGDNGGPLTWGNPASLNALGQYMTRLRNRPDVHDTKYGLVSASMGGLVSLNYAAAQAVKPRAIVSVIPVINLFDIAYHNRDGYGVGISAAFGGYNEGTHGGNYNPHTMRNMDKLKGVPMLLFYGLSDTLCLPQFTEEFAAADPAYRTLVPLSSGHDYTTYANVDHDLIVDFLRTHLQ